MDEQRPAEEQQARAQAVSGREGVTKGIDVEHQSIRLELGRLSLPEGFVPPPVRLAPPAQLDAAAWAAPAMVRLVGFVDWVGKGRVLNDEGELQTAAVREVAALLKIEVPEGDSDELNHAVEQAEVQLTLEWAALADFVYQRGPRLYRTRAGKGLDSEPLAAWTAAFESMLELGVVDIDGNGPPWGSTIDDAMADVVVRAHLGARPISLDAVVDWLWEEEDLLQTFQGDRELQDGFRDAMAYDARRMCGALAAMGVVVLEEGSLRPTPLGSWAAVQLMRDDGVHVAVVGEHADEGRRNRTT